MVKSKLSRIRQGKFKSQPYHSFTRQSWLHFLYQVLWIEDKFHLLSFLYLCQRYHYQSDSEFRVRLSHFLGFPISPIKYLRILHFSYFSNTFLLSLTTKALKLKMWRWKWSLKNVSHLHFLLDIPDTCYYFIILLLYAGPFFSAILIILSFFTHLWIKSKFFSPIF